MLELLLTSNTTIPLTLFIVFMLLVTFMFLYIKRGNSIFLKTAIGVFASLWTWILALCLLVVLCSFFFYNQEPEDLGNNFAYDSEGNRILADNERYIPAIVSYAYDERFIIAKQKATKGYHETGYYPIMEKKTGVYQLKRDTVYYWLIVKQEQKIFGLLDSNSFRQLAKEHEVPDKLMDIVF